MTFPDKTTWKFQALDGSPAQGKIAEIRDSNNNVMTFLYGPGGRLVTVTDTLGRNVTVSYNGAGYISALTDFQGRQVQYSYYGALEVGGMPGDLKSVTSPAVTGTPTGNDFPSGKTTTYTYTQDMPQAALNHNLLTIRDAAGQVVLENTYATAQDPADPRIDRIDRQTLPNGTIDYVYVAQSPSPGSDAVTKTIVNDRQGNVEEVFFDALNQVVMERAYTGRAPNPALPTDDTSNRPAGKLRSTDPDSFETRYTWSPDSLLTSVVFPEGNSIQNTYDAGNPDVRLRANLLESVRSPGPRGGDQTSITESWTYGTTFGTEPCVCPGCCGEGGGSNGLVIIAGVSVGYSYAKRAAIMDNQRKDVAAVKTFVEQAIASKHAISVGVKVYSSGGLSYNNMTTGRVFHGYFIAESDSDGNRMAPWTTYHDGLGHTYTRDIDPATGNLLQATAPTVTTGVLSGGTQTITEGWQYNTFGQVTRFTNPTGRVDDYTYHTSGPATGYLKDITVDAPSPLPGSHFALLTVTARDAFGNLTAATDPNGNTETFVYNQLDEVVRHVAKPPFGYQTDFYYDANDRLLQTDVQNVDETGAIEPNAYVSTNHRYDSLGHVLRKSGDMDTLKIKTDYVYDPNDRVTLVKLPESVNGHQPTNVVRTLFDERGLAFRVTRAEGDPGASTTQWDYDGNGNLVRTREGLESAPRVTTYQHDGYDRRVSVTDAMGNVTTRHYDANGNVISARTDGELIDGESGPNVRLAEVSMTYDEVDRLVQSDVAFFDTASATPLGDGSSTTKTFHDEASEVVRTEDDNGHGLDLSYDSANRVSSSHDPKGNTSAYGYDANGNVLTVTETEVSDLPTPPETFVTTSTFDSLDRVTSTTDNAGHAHHFLWDSRNNPTVTLDAKGNETRTIYDALSRPTQTQRKMLDTGEAGGNLVYVLDQIRAYDADSRLVGQADDNGNQTTYQYDPRDRLVATLHADGTSELQSYDVHDNLVSAVDANGTTTTSSFDADNRLTARSITRAAGVLGTTSETWKYDGVSRIVSAQNDGSLVTRAYDSLSNVTQETQKIGSGPTRTLTAAYDGEGNRTAVTYPSGLALESTYDELERRKTITASGPGTCSGGSTPGAFCSTSSDCLPGGTCVPLSPLVTTYDYAGPGRVVRRTNGNNTESTYAYDNVRRVTETVHLKITPHDVIDDRVYDWDAMDNKTSRTDVRVPGSGTAHQYGYDSAYRMIHSVESVPGTPPVTIDYTLDGVDNRTSVTGGAESGPYMMSSALPEPADREVNQYTSTPFDGARTYDRNGNLVTKPGTGESMSYDYHDQMVASSGPVGSSTYAYDPFWRRVQLDGNQYFYDGDQEIEERNGSGTLTRAFVYGNGIDELALAVADVDLDGLPDRSVPHADDLGSVVAVTRQSGDVLERYDYGDGGKPRFFTPGGSSIAQSAIGNPILFQSHRYDKKTGLYDYRTRYLDPSAGRFTSGDSLGTWGDEGSLGNRSAFAGSNPWSRTDPAGEEAAVVLVCSAKKSRSNIQNNFVAGGGFNSGLNSGFNGLVVSRAKTTEAKVVLGGIKTSEESFRKEGIPAGEVMDCAPNTYRTAKLCPGHISCPPVLSSSTMRVTPVLLYEPWGGTAKTVHLKDGNGDYWSCSCLDWMGYDCTKAANWYCECLTCSMN